MKRALLVERGRPPDTSWSEWRVVWLLKEHKNCWRIWSLRDVFPRYIHKESMGIKVEEL